MKLQKITDHAYDKVGVRTRVTHFAFYIFSFLRAIYLPYKSFISPEQEYILRTKGQFSSFPLTHNDLFIFRSFICTNSTQCIYIYYMWIYHKIGELFIFFLFNHFYIFCLFLSYQEVNEIIKHILCKINIANNQNMSFFNGKIKVKLEFIKNVFL